MIKYDTYKVCGADQIFARKGVVYRHILRDCRKKLFPQTFIAAHVFKLQDRPVITTQYQLRSHLIIVR